jgi:hypothetical protein
MRAATTEPALVLHACREYSRDASAGMRQTSLFEFFSQPIGGRQGSMSTTVETGIYIARSPQAVV